MQEKTIKSILQRKLEDWLASITDNDSLKEMIRKDAIVTGGAIPSMLMGENPNDYDFYFKTYETTKAVAEYYVEKFKKNPPSRFKNKEDVVGIKVISTEENNRGRIKIVVKSQGIASESGSDNYQYFEQANIDPSEPSEFVESIAQDVEDSKKKDGEGKYRPIFLTSNAITLSEKIQIIIRFYGPIDQIH